MIKLKIALNSIIDCFGFLISLLVLNQLLIALMLKMLANCDTIYIPVFLLK